MTLGSYKFHLRVGLPLAFPLRLPELTVLSVEPQLELPHLVGDHQLCFESETNLLLDRRDPWGIVQESLARAREMLHRLITGGRAEEFAQEIVAYWATPARIRLDCDVDATERPHLTQILFSKQVPIAVADDPFAYGQSRRERRADDLARQNAIYIPIDPVAVDPEFDPRELMKPEGIRKYIRALPEADRREVARLLGHCTQRQELVVLGVKRPRGERARVGVWFPRVRGKHPLADELAQDLAIPVALRRRDLAFLAPRGGAGAELQKRQVLIVGCGAVGGHVALILARAGIGQISLVDPDSFELENTYRHVCGMAHVDLTKVQGLRQELQRLIPYVKVVPYEEEIENLLVRQPEVLAQHDLVISALGSPTVEMHLNERIWSSTKHPPAIFAWLEPLGIGGHVLATHVPKAEGFSRGCLECLYHRPVEEGPLENRAAFATPGINYTRDVLGCGSTYLPFADLDSLRTAEMAARFALRILHRQLEGAPLVSWKGDALAFEKVGYRATPRFDAISGPFSEEQVAHVRESCPVCAS
ncbi:ThiF family adenylyltransferase [Vitiosangium sp. GDMCC 1.1324]|uniref:ThiF family adenylyltransferase n=1 Tax=Vitiosangium sp. (strain GDMCC 1.1324) TaxID=2138576 RepID=UPI00130EC7AC|nr:ThiF family adenylyltransferase [Vitiosangium sp. GDMCC 1.1324]